MSEPQNQKPKNLLERLGALEEAIGQYQGVATLAKNLRDAFSVLVETVDAFIEETCGKDLSDRLSARLAAKRDAARLQRNQRAKSVLEQLVKTGQLESVPAIDATTVIIGSESNENGVVVDEYVQTSFQNLVPEAQAKVLGQGVGFVLEHNGSKLTVSGIYRMKAADAPALSETTEPPAAASEAPAATSAETPASPPQTAEIAPETPAAPPAEAPTDVIPAAATPSTETPA